MRLALGASRARLIRQALTESALLGLMGGVLGLVVSVWAIQALANGIPEGFSKFIPGWTRLGINFTVLAFTFGVSLVGGDVSQGWRRFGTRPGLTSMKHSKPAAEATRAKADTNDCEACWLFPK